MLRHKRNVHIKEKYIHPLPPAAKSTNMTFKHLFSMVIIRSQWKWKIGMDSKITLVLSNTANIRAYHMLLWPMASSLQ